jgi:hypothetical protein
LGELTIELGCRLRPDHSGEIIEMMRWRGRKGFRAAGATNAPSTDIAPDIRRRIVGAG